LGDRGELVEMLLDLAGWYAEGAGELLLRGVPRLGRADIEEHDRLSLDEPRVDLIGGQLAGFHSRRLLRRGPGPRPVDSPFAAGGRASPRPPRCYASTCRGRPPRPRSGSR